MFNQRKNKRFNYTPRHQVTSESQNDSNFRERWDEVRAGTRQKGAARRGLIRLLMILGMIIVIWYLLTRYETS